MLPIQVLIADDDLLFADLLADFLSHSEEFEIVDTVGDGYEVLNVIEKNDIDVLLLDLNMPNMDGMETMKQLKLYYPEIKIIVLSSNYEANTIEHALKNGATGYLTKTVERDELVNSIKKVYSGEMFYCKASVEAIMNRMMKPSRKGGSSNGKDKDLTARELEILELIVAGYTSPEIADELLLSFRTVETHRRNIIRKLNQKNTPALVNYAIKEKLV